MTLTDNTGSELGLRCSRCIQNRLKFHCQAHTSFNLQFPQQECLRRTRLGAACDTEMVTGAHALKLLLQSLLRSGMQRKASRTQ